MRPHAAEKVRRLSSDKVLYRMAYMLSPEHLHSRPPLPRLEPRNLLHHMTRWYILMSKCHHAWKSIRCRKKHAKYIAYAAPLTLYNIVVP